MDKLQKFKQAMKREWYTQGFNAVPVFLNHAAYSGMVMKKDVGYGYTHFFYRYQDGYGEMSYDPQDFARLWRIVKAKLKKDKDYLKKLKKRYEQLYSKYRKIFIKIDGINLKNMNDPSLLELLKTCSRSLIDGVSFAHVLEAVGLGAEKELKTLLEKRVKDAKTRNQYFTELTIPSKPSFLKQEEDELLAISKLRANKQAVALAKHAKKYFWIQNNYAAPRSLTPAFFARRMKQLNKFPKPKSIQAMHDVNYRAVAKLAKPFCRLIDFCTIWQDERKANILTSIGYFDQVLREVARRTKTPLSTLYYLGVKDVAQTKSLPDFSKTHAKLISRSRGCFSLIEYDNEWFVTGTDYRKLKGEQDRILDHTHQATDLHGSVANRGTAIGRVKICNNLEAIGKVKTGDVLVASMTRPEFMPALKKAAAIVTDEGGITCHAAIVSRELGKPCIIGTKIATKVLKDGDTVEVRANHGIVKIL